MPNYVLGRRTLCRLKLLKVEQKNLRNPITNIFPLEHSPCRSRHISTITFRQLYRCSVGTSDFNFSTIRLPGIISGCLDDMDVGFRLGQSVRDRLGRRKKTCIKCERGVNRCRTARFPFFRNTFRAGRRYNAYKCVFLLGVTEVSVPKSLMNSLSQ